MSKTTYKVLIVDDDADVRGVLRLILKQSNFQVVGEAKDSAQAMEKIKKLNPQIVLLDIHMPGVSGLEAMVEMHIEYPDIQVVMISGSAAAEDVRTAIERGAVGYIVKPFNVHNVLQYLELAEEKIVEKLKHAV